MSWVTLFRQIDMHLHFPGMPSPSHSRRVHKLGLIKLPKIVQSFSGASLGLVKNIAKGARMSSSSKAFQEEHLIWLIDIVGGVDEVACGIRACGHDVLEELPRVALLLDPHAQCKGATAAPATRHVY